MHLSKQFTYFFLLPIALLNTSGCDSPAPRAAPPPPKVSVAHPIAREEVDSDTYNGWIAAEETVEVRARVRGHIDKVNFTDGEMVKKGQVLFELDPRPFQSDIDRAKEQLNVYQAQLVAAQKDEARLKELLSKGGSSQSQVDKAEADALSFAAEAESAKQEIKRQELNLEYSKINAPIAGRVSRAQMTVGNLVNAGGSDPILTTIVSVDPVYVYFPVDERAMQRYMGLRKDVQVRSGSIKERNLKFYFELDTEKGFPHEGVLDFIDNKVDQDTGTVPVRGTIPNPNGLFVAGSRVKVRVPIGEARLVTLVPDSAVLSDQDKKYILIVDDKNIVQRRDFSPGRLIDGMRVVLEGEKGPVVTPADWVIVQGIQSARINYPVEPIRPDASSAPKATSASKPATASQPATSAH